MLPPPSHPSFFSASRRRRGSFAARQIMLTKGSSPTSAVTSSGMDSNKGDNALTAAHKDDRAELCVEFRGVVLITSCWEVHHESTFSLCCL